MIRIATGGDRERILSLTLPDVARDLWTPAKVATGLPPTATYLPTSTDLWKFLACLGGLGLLAEWYLFGGGRRPAFMGGRSLQQGFSTASVAPKVERKEELVSR